MITVPTALTLARLAAAPGLVLPFLLLPRPTADAWALAIFLVAASTDWLDGWLARRLRQESALGRVLDPIADKAMVAVALALLLALGTPALTPPEADLTGPWAAGQAMAWPLALPVVLILSREIAVSGLREALGPGAALTVTPLAKWKTAAQMTAIALLLAAPLWRSRSDVGPQPVGDLGAMTSGAATAHLVTLAGTAMLWIAAVITLVTGWDYAVKAIAYIRDREEC